MNYFTFAGANINNLSIKEGISEIEKLIKDNKPSYIVTPNAAHITLLQRDKEFKEVYKNAKLIFPDGKSLIWSSKIMGFPLKERITGLDLLFSLSSLASQKNYKIYFLGASTQVIKKTVENLRYKFPNLQIAGYHHGYFFDEKEVISKINKLEPHILFIGMGFPKQEKWIYAHINQLKIKIAICVGGVFDIIAGKVYRAPLWMQNLGLEWFFRLIQEPRRLWKRYLIGNTLFIWLVLKEFMKTRLHKDSFIN